MSDEQHCAAANLDSFHFSLWRRGIHAKPVDDTALLCAIFGIEGKCGGSFSKRPVYHRCRATSVQIYSFPDADVRHEVLQFGQRHAGAIGIIFNRYYVYVLPTL
ncbi:hypothetical protein D3C81_1263160 [compost metagenome]